MKCHLLIATIAILNVTPALAEPELKGSPAELSAYLATLPKMVSVTGESEVKAPADRASVTLRVRTEHKLLQEALRLNQEIREKVAGLVAERGVEANRVQSSRFASTQRFGLFSDKAKNHQVDHFVKITVRDEKEFQIVASAVDKWAEVHYVGTEFEHSDKETLKTRAIAQACDKALERKKVFEERLGVTLTPKRFSQELVPAARIPDNPGDYPSLKRVQNATPLPTSPPGSYVASVDEGQSAFGELVYSARVTVEFGLEARR